MSRAPDPRPRSPEAQPDKQPRAKLRLDRLLVEHGLAASRERAQALILAGRVLVNEQRQDKPGVAVARDAALRLLGEDMRYVSRGGLKLEGALAAWSLDVRGRACADIGASTGGFTDCLLQAGAASVLAVDTGYGQIAHKLRVDTRVHLLERTNARTLAPGALVGNGVNVTHLSDGKTVAKIGHPDLGHAPVHIPVPLITFFAMDVSFIGASLVLPAVVAALAPAGVRWQGEAVILVKPQFEAGREHVGKGGIVRDPEAHALAVERVRAAVIALGGQVLGTMESPILGMEGNREFLLHTRWAQNDR